MEGHQGHLEAQSDQDESRSDQQEGHVLIAGRELGDDGAKAGWCLYKVGCKGPTTYNACSSTRWNEGVSFPIGSGHGCLGCSEDGFWDKGSFYDRLSGINGFGIEANADQIGLTVLGVTGAAVAAHPARSAIHCGAGGSKDEAAAFVRPTCLPR